MTATTNRLGLAAMRAFPAGSATWGVTFDGHLDSLEDRLTLLATTLATQSMSKQCHWVGQHCIRVADKAPFIGTVVGLASQAVWQKLFYATDYLPGTATMRLNWTAGQRGEPLSATGATSYALDLAARNNFVLILNSNFALANPLNALAGQSGIIEFRHGATPRVMTSKGSFWNTRQGQAILLSTVANAIDLGAYYTVSATHIHLSLSEKSSH